MEIDSLGPDRLPHLVLSGMEGAAQLAERFPCELISCLLWRTAPDWRIERRTLADSMLFIAVRGSFELEVGRQHALIGPGDVGIIPHGAAHRAHYAGDCRFVEVFAIHFHALDIWGTHALALFNQPAARLTDRQSWFRRLRRLTALADRHPRQAVSIARPLLATLLAELALEGAGLRRQAPAADPRIAAQLLRLQDDPGLNVGELASAAGLSAVRFRTLFHQATGRAPKAYAARLRIERAAGHLRSSTMPVKQVAATSGFCSDHYFHHCFKAAFGMSASAYRRSLADVRL